MSEINLRPARPDEYARIRELVLQNNLNPFGLDGSSFIVAADKHDQLIGCGQIKRHGDVEELASLVVVDEWQGRGVSSPLMEALLQRGSRPLWLMCESPLTPYYRKFGFAEINNPVTLPIYFQGIYWFTRFNLGPMFLMRGTYVAFMVLEN